MSIRPSDTAFLLRRAHEEAVQAILGDGSVASKIHDQLALCYSVRAVQALRQNRLA